MRLLLLLLTGALFVLSCANTDGLQRMGGDKERWIEVVPVGDVSAEVLSLAVSVVEDGFGVDARLSAPMKDISAAFNSKRKQFRADALLGILAKRKTVGSLRCIGVVEEDIYTEGHNYVFGVASENVGCCLISVLRLGGRFWGMEDDAELLALRTKKLILHELGHTFGLKHCQDGCVMAFANSLMELDRLSDGFCPECTERLKRALRGKR